MTEPNLIGGLAGGALIGLAAVLMLALIGRIAGVSGIVGGLVAGVKGGDRLWRATFVIGLITGAGAYALTRGVLPLHLQTDGPGLAIAGLLVGLGTRIGSGCTSGHGVCGMARRSPRSLAATAIFMAAAMLTVFITRHILL